MDRETETTDEEQDAATVLYADPDEAERAAVAEEAADALADVAVETAPDGPAVATRLETGGVDCLVADSEVPGLDWSALPPDDPPLVLYTAADPGALADPVVERADTVVEKGNGERSRRFLVEKVRGALRDGPDRAESARRRATARLEAPAADRTHQFLCYVDGTVMWESEPFESVFPVDAVRASLPDTDDFYERLTALLADAPEAVRAVRRIETRAEPTAFAVPTTEGRAYYRHTEYPLPEKFGPLRLVTVEEVTGRVETAARRDLLETVVDRAGDGVYTLDENGVIDFCNEAFASMLGYERADLVGEHAAVTLVEGELVTGQRAVETLRSDPDREQAVVEMTFEDSDGEPLPVAVNFSLLSEDGAYAGLLGVARDLTEPRFPGDRCSRN